CPTPAAPAHPATVSDRWLPSPFDPPKRPPPRLVVRFLTVEVFGVVDSFLAATGRCVVRINTQNLIVAFHRQIVPAGLIKVLCLSEPLFYLFHPLRKGQR